MKTSLTIDDVIEAIQTFEIEHGRLADTCWVHNLDFDALVSEAMNSRTGPAWPNKGGLIPNPDDPPFSGEGKSAFYLGGTRVRPDPFVPRGQTACGFTFRIGAGW